MPKSNPHPVGELFVLGTGNFLGNFLFSVVVAVLVGLGFVYKIAWLGALVVCLGGGLYIRERQRIARSRFHCAACGIDYPHDMIRAS